MSLSKVFMTGTQGLNFSAANKVRLMNIVALITVGISLIYTLNYFFVLKHPLVGFINACFTLAYAATILLNKWGAIKEAKVWFFSILMLHLLVCTNVYVTNASGFHLYYFLVPTGAFLLFELNEKFEKLMLSSVAVILFFYCENTPNLQPLIELTPEMNHMLYQSVIFFNMVEVIIVLTLFSSKIEENESMLYKQATTDSLTGIANRHFFFEKGEKLLTAARSHNRHLSMVLLDFDHFKSINDDFGHASGDLCLKLTGELIQNNLRKNDFFARIGGEEFAIIMPETTLGEANNVAEKIRLLVNEQQIPLTDGSTLSCSVSIGICAKTLPEDEIKTLLVNADVALYKAKENGRNRVHLFQ